MQLGKRCLLTMLLFVLLSFSAQIMANVSIVRDNPGTELTLPNDGDNAETPTQMASYVGTTKISIVEVYSRWKDNDGYNYENAHLWYPLNGPINIPDLSTWDTTVYWNSLLTGLTLDSDNLAAVGAVFKDTYDVVDAYPPNGYWFSSYYSDASATAYVGRFGQNMTPSGYTHSVYIEEGTATWWGYCPLTRAALATIVSWDTYPINHVTLVGDMVVTAYNRLNIDYNFAGYPTTFFDGGDTLVVGGYPDTYTYTSRIAAVGARAVPDLDYLVLMDYLGGTDYAITVRIGNGVPANTDPITPVAPTGPATAGIDELITFDAVSTDPDSDDLYYQFDFGDGKSLSPWIGPYTSGSSCNIEYAFSSMGSYDVSVRTKDIWDATTDFSPTSSVTVGCCVGDRGNIDGDPADGVDIGDLVYLVAYSFTSGPPPPCFEEADVDGSLGLDIGDLVYMVAYSFTGGPAPVSCM